MAQFFTDFSGYTIGNTPSDWTSYWTSTSFTIRASASYTGGKYAELAELTGYQRTGWAWDDVGTSADAEVLIRFNSGTAGVLLPALRASGTTSRSGYILLVRNDYNSLEIRRSVNNSETTLGTQAVTINDNTLYWVRFRVNGDNIRVKFWADGDSEPSSWTKEVTDSSDSKISSAGRIQIGTTGNTGNNFLIDVFGVGTGGDFAPSRFPSPIIGEKYPLPPFRRS